MKHARIHLSLIVACWLGVCAVRAEETHVPGHLAVLVGAGESFPGWGATTERVKTLDMTLRYAGLVNRNFGPKEWHLREQLWIELPLFWAFEPSDGPIFSMNFLLCILYERYASCQPYMTLGGGPVYAEADIPGMGSRLCGNYQAGGGIRFPFGRTALHIEARYHHISNLGMADPNVPINSLRGLLGLSWEY